jgi:hypothetical protein
MDAAMDPNKYKEEYQKKLYKMLTGQQSGREAETGAKREMKKDDKDLLNIFSRYAAGELPRAALKSFVRQAQLQRKVAKGENQGKMWWNVSWDNGRIEVVADNEKEAIDTAFKESYWAPDQPNTPEAQRFRNSLKATPLRPFGPAPANEPNWYIKNRNSSDVIKVFYAPDYTEAHEYLQRYKRENNITDDSLTYGQVASSPQAMQMVAQQAQAARPSASTDQGNWGIWIDANNRFANQPGSYARGETPPLYRFPSRAAAELWIEQQRAERPNMRADIEVREIPPRLLPGSTLDLQRQRAAQASQDVDTTVPYELYNRTTGAVIDTFPAHNDDEARIRLDDYRNHGQHGQPQHIATQLYGVRRGPGVTNTASNTRSNLIPHGPGPWEVANMGNNQVYYNPGHTNRAAAEIEARTWLTQNGYNPEDFVVRTRETASNRDAAQGGLIDVATDQPTQAPRTLTTPGQGQQVFTGQWQVVDNNGQELYRFGGVGNSQGDANRVAQQWVNTQRAQGNAIDAREVDVLPVMGEAE